MLWWEWQCDGGGSCGDNGGGDSEGCGGSFDDNGVV